MRRYGFMGLLVWLLLLAGVALGSYQLGVSAGTTSAAVDAGAMVVVPAHWGAAGFGGFPFFGFLFGFAFLVLIIGSVGRMARWGGHHPWGHMAGPGMGRGPGPWTHGGPTPPPHVDAWLGGWHDQAHGTPRGGVQDAGAQDASGANSGPGPA